MGEEKQKKKMSLLEKAVCGLILLVGALTLYQHFEGKYQNLYNSVSLYADENHDGFTSHQEWAKQYHKLGLPYDANNPIKLSTEQLKQLRRPLSSY